MDEALQTAEDKTWFQDGVVFTEFANPLTFDSVRAMQDRGLELVTQNEVELAPYVVILSGDAQGKLRFSLPDMAKMVRHNFTKHVGGIWVVGRTASHSKIMDTMNHFFFADRIHFVGSIEQATAGAKQAAGDGLNVLERDED